MEQITILLGNTTEVFFDVADLSGNPVDLTQGDYQLTLDEKSLDFGIRGENNNQIYFTLQGKEMMRCGVYSLILWKNRGHDGQLRTLIKNCIKIING